ncbi:hypothetical protein BS50DRAFT_362651 [Corynespora cassiicola Philippines]|uniref:Uncharacterized protein n=1 Tax=Corynespora cassiicola Philippines TaxID=1448308 RepID=A0A2T2NSL9_CORCC|nr:hypothetical protein BS50DRAFT_362651 [Corynespora cassiicola Philippines]
MASLPFPPRYSITSHSFLSIPCVILWHTMPSQKPTPTPFFPLLAWFAASSFTTARARAAIFSCLAIFLLPITTRSAYGRRTSACGFSWLDG